MNLSANLVKAGIVAYSGWSAYFLFGAKYPATNPFHDETLTPKEVYLSTHLGLCLAETAAFFACTTGSVRHNPRTILGLGLTLHIAVWVYDFTITDKPAYRWNKPACTAGSVGSVALSLLLMKEGLAL
ncbi:hypothetical protein SARC_12852 [Sphaeroforma arctica JP610]|uniref:Uncharacterized protein n=1 Tax=Sphaeroforma arctica JP610 TaxID=667725 RepID=A0A0L0FDT0_9EUKA|nr:hypothetical protein SARC_12852 [Sphaeroforma arctica JP610]KNC74606.1 hypothetical protein SARC_12852 [Sphaeroforma arctica JP610]|eukprot:XP_014148508.1 hypothetical protein SARC_12852 [Sphaeroforma arctica JP610]